MKNRIRFISHKQKKILLVDGTGCSAEQLEEFATLVPARVTAEASGIGAASGGFHRRAFRQEERGAF